MIRLALVLVLTLSRTSPGAAGLGSAPDCLSRPASHFFKSRLTSAYRQANSGVRGFSDAQVAAWPVLCRGFCEERSGVTAQHRTIRCNG